MGRIELENKHVVDVILLPYVSTQTKKSPLTPVG
jgi:hypothetical protein